MEFRQLGGSRFKVPALCLGTGTFGAQKEHIRAFGVTEVEEATKLGDAEYWSTGVLEYWSTGALECRSHLAQNLRKSSGPLWNFESNLPGIPFCNS
jgi:hypothetical protein